MSLESSLVPILFDKAIDQKKNYKVHLPGEFLTLDNAVRRKEALWEKRPGFTATANPASSAGWNLGRLEEGLCYADGAHVSAYSPSANVWNIAAGVAASVPFSRQSVIRHSGLTLGPSSACAGGLIMTVATTDFNGSVLINVTDAATGAVVQPTTTLAGTSGASGAKVVAQGTNFFIFGVVLGSPSTLKVWKVASSLFSTPGQVGNILVSPVSIGPCVGNYDVALYDSGAWMVAYQTTTHGTVTVAPVLTSTAALGNGSNGYPAPTSVVKVSTSDIAASTLSVFCVKGLTFLCYANIPGADPNLYAHYWTANFATTSSFIVDSSAVNKRNVAMMYYPDPRGDNLFGGAVNIFYETGSPTTSADGYKATIRVGYWTMGTSSNVTGSSSTNTGTDLWYTFGLASKIWQDARGNYYFIAAYDSALQSSYFLLQINIPASQSAPSPYGGSSSIPYVGGYYVLGHYAIGGQGAGLTKSYYTGGAGNYGTWLTDVATDGNGHYWMPLTVIMDEVTDTSLNRTINTTGIDLYKMTLGSVQPLVRTNLGATVQFTGGLVHDYDGQKVAELGFHIYPENIAVTKTTGGGLTGGSTTYYFKVCWEHTDNKGQVHRSTPSPTVTVTGVTASTGKIVLSIPALFLTNRPLLGTYEDIQCVVYQSTDNQVFYRAVSGQFGFSVSRALYYIVSITTEVAPYNPLLYALGSTLENDSLPACNVSHVHKNRMWLAGLEYDAIWFSKEFQQGLGPAFSAAFQIPVESIGGTVTALATLDDKLVIFKKDRLYYTVGDGPDDTGNGWDYPEPVRIPSQVGTVYPRSIVELENGIIFKSAKGWYMLTRALQVVYIGAPVEDYNSLTPTSATVVADQTEVRILHSNGAALVYNSQFNQWSTFSNYTGRDSVVVSGSYYRLGTDGRVYVETPGLYLDNGSPITLTVETSWLSLARLQGYQRVYKLQLLSDFVADHTLQVQIAYDFKSTYNQTINFPTTGVISGTTFSLQIQPQIQKCSAIKIKFTDTASTTASLKPTSLAVEVGRKKGAARLSPAQSV